MPDCQRPAIASKWLSIHRNCVSDVPGVRIARPVRGGAPVPKTVLPDEAGLRLIENRHSRTRSACGYAQSAMGPFYCPNDQKVYLDTSFFQDLERRFHACDVAGKTCQFSEAYVIAHEVGHHVQNLLGILPKARQLQQGLDKVEANHVQVRVELQADCLAGVWAFHAEEKWRFMEAGDVESALKTASAIGDDRLQRQATGYVVPDAFTHGSAEQRTRWFTTGLKSGSLASCDTFGAAQL